MDLPDGGTAVYLYDPFGRRYLKDVDGQVTYFVYSDEGLIGEYDAAGAIKKGYGWKPGNTWGTDPVFMIESGQYYYYHNDHLGTPQKMTDGSGTVVWSSEYTAFGEAQVAAASTITNNLRFPGQYFDAETGLHYNWNRYYDPGTGRYTQVDPIGFAAGDENLYRYVGNNAVNWIDPSGLDWLDNLSNFSAGMGDTITFGGTAWIRQQLGSDGAVNKCSGMYTGGKVAGYAWQTAVLGVGSTPRGWLLGRGRGILNSNDYFRIGWSWKGTAQQGREIIRIAIGSKRLPIHWHFP